MKILSNKVYLELSELIECGISGNTVMTAHSRKSNSWEIIPHTDDGRKFLVGFDKLRDDYKLKVQARFGDPYNYVAKAPILDMLKSDLEAEQFFLSYKYDGDKMLPEDRVKKYTREACWLNMLLHADDNMKDIRKLLGLRMEDFYKHVGELLGLEKQREIITGKFPENYVNLKSRMRRYRAEKYPSLIPDQYGNKCAAKVNDDFSESLLLELIAHPNQYDDVLVAMEYNTIAVEKGYKPITSGTVGGWRRKKGFLVTAQREGLAAFDDRFRKQIAGCRPSAPLYLVESDDNHLDLFFLDLADVTSSKYYHKYKAIVVVDSFNDYILGYAYAENLSVELVKAAYINAMYHIRELTGGWYLPHEVRTDNWAIAALQAFYESMAHFHKSPTGSKKRGYIEQLFGSTHFERCKKLGANNYTGHNISAKTRGVNEDFLKGNLKSFPTVGDEATLQLETFFYRLRNVPAKGTLSKQAEWLKAWNELPATEKREITDEQFLQKFGIAHNPQGRRIAISNMGVNPQINGSKYLYDVPANLHLENIGKAVTVIYDPFDMSRVLVTDGQGLRFVATTVQLAPKSIKDMKPGDRTHINALLAQKKDQSSRVAGEGERRKAMLFEKGIDPENLLQGGVMEKGLKQWAELSYQAGTNVQAEQDDDFNPLDAM